MKTIPITIMNRQSRHEISLVCSDLAERERTNITWAVLE